MGDNFAKHAIVVGGGMAGLLAAAAMSNFFEAVTICECDDLEDDDEVRPGVPQGAHIHTLLGYGAQSIERLLPEFNRRLYKAGAVKIRRNLDIWFHDFRGPTPRRDVGILTPAMTQPLLERVTRQIVLERGNVTLRRGADCTIRIENGDATGVMFEGPDGGFLEGDLIIDASGRNSRLAKHLADAGFGEVESQDLRILMTYTSGLFRPPAKWRDPPFACLMLPVAPGRRAGYISAVENGLWIASAFARAEDVCPRDDEGFLEWVAGLSHPVIHERLRESDPVSPKKICRMLSSRWRHYETMRDFPKRLVPLGDSFVSLNPMYGQGMTLAAHQALALRNALASHSCSGTDRDRIADTYFESCTAINQIGWIVAETRDLTFDTTDGPRPADIEDRWALQHGLSRLAEQDPDVQRLLVRMTHFLDPPSVLMEPGLVRRAMDASG